MATPLDPTALGFLLAENRRMPMHVGGLQLYRKPPDAGRGYVRALYERMRDTEQVAPLFLRHPSRSARTVAQWVWVEDEAFDIEYHLRHSALPKPGRIRELLELTSRLHSTRLAIERPLWEWHVIEGLRDGRIAMFGKFHHALMDGLAATRLLQSSLSTDPDRRDLPAPWAARPAADPREPGVRETVLPDPRSLADIPTAALRQALGLTADAAGLPAALVRTLTKGLRNETSALSFYAPRTILNQTITGSRRFAAQDWPIARLRAVGRATRTTLNDVVLAMVSGAVRAYLSELEALPDSTLIAMVPVAFNTRQAQQSGAGGNAIGTVMVKLGTDLADPAERLRTVHESMKDGKEAMASMTPLQILAMSALGQAPAILPTLLRMQGLTRPPYNLVISNVPGPRTPHYYNGAQLLGNYPASIPIDGMALNITCYSYAGTMNVGLTGCRRTVPHLQRLLGHLDAELGALERAAEV